MFWLLKPCDKSKEKLFSEVIRESRRYLPAVTKVTGEAFVKKASTKQWQTEVSYDENTLEECLYKSLAQCQNPVRIVKQSLRRF